MMARARRLFQKLRASAGERLHPVLPGRPGHSGDFLGTDHSRDVGVLNDGSRCISKVDRIDLLKCGLGENHETTHVATGGQLQKVEGGYGADVNTGNVSERSPATFILVDNEEWSLSVDVSAVPRLALTSTDVLTVANLLDIRVGLDSLEEGNGVLGLLDSLNRVLDDQGKLGNVADAVSACLDEGGDGAGLKS